MWEKILYTVIAFLVLSGFRYVVNRKIQKIADEKKISLIRHNLIKKVIFFFLVLFFIISIIGIWGIDYKDMWIYISSIVGIIAIGFFAHWSLLSNVTANFLLFIFVPFKIGDKIFIIPDDISGVVIDFNLIYILIETENKEKINIPNNMFFQKYIKVIKSDKI